MRLRWLQKRPPTQNNHRGVFVVIQKIRTKKGEKQAIGTCFPPFFKFLTTQNAYLTTSI